MIYNWVSGIFGLRTGDNKLPKDYLKVITLRSHWSLGLYGPFCKYLLLVDNLALMVPKETRLSL